jgi:HAD superfamily hydrolase (TIGR01509 family)
MSSNRAVLWDMDGTLVDSGEYHWQAWRDTMAREGFPITREQFLASFGQRNDTILRQWLGEQATPGVIEHIGEAKEALYRLHVRKQGIHPLPGVADWVHRLHQQGWRQAIASAAPRANIETILEVLSGTDWFEATVSAEDVHKGKPDPEVYILAAERVGVAPARCIVVEDAVAGIEGARAAAMRSIGVSYDGRHLPADVVVRSLDLLNANAFDHLLQDGITTRGEARLAGLHCERCN